MAEGDCTVQNCMSPGAAHRVTVLEGCLCQPKALQRQVTMCNKWNRLWFEATDGHILGITLTFRWPGKQQCESELNKMGHSILLLWVRVRLEWWVIDFFLKCAFGVPGVVIQRAHSVTGEDKTIHPFSSHTKQPTPRKQQYVPQTDPTAAHQSGASCRLPD